MALKRELNKYKNQLKDKISYSYVDQHIYGQKINDYKFLCLIILMQETPLPKQRKEDYIIATMLVETALFIHERVRENDEILEDFDQALEKQLSVLGGDYYSSLYYVLLANTEDFSFINYLATAIKEVNELKMNFYFQDEIDFKDCLDLRNQIDSHIIKSVAKYIDVKDKSLMEIIERTLLLDLLLREKEFHKEIGYFNYFKQETISENPIEKIDRVINKCYLKLNTLIAESSNKYVQQILDLFEQENIKYLVHTEEG